ncbi:2'-5' RNA ligase family protein [Paenibacillus chibensis]|uniref:2'-5' RNA ligase family protein n=1 Tax=Paenibacillus chibensis TaxID=59846 RepID=A0ABU6PPF3_9BACL|nr:2'-5' RNA ligase family protein [Paenibacillus chibensis]
MQYFIGIVPPEAYLHEIKEFQKPWAEEGTEPHITVKAQSALTLDLEWLPKVEEVCLHTEPFKVSLSHPDFFGESVLFLSVISEGIYSFHKALFHKIAPSTESINQYFELEHYVPHLTLGQSSHGVSREQLIEMYAKSEKVLSPYPSFVVSSVRVFRQESIRQKYTKYIDVPLGGTIKENWII